MNNKWQTIKIFLSSTFKDMHTERDHLLRVVFPLLKARCRKVRINLIEIDLRWGVTEKEAEDGKVLDICLDEIEACRPFFVGILGHRYGWIPPGDKFSITAQEIYHGVLHNFVPHQVIDLPKIIETRWEDKTLTEAQKNCLLNNYQWNADKSKYLLKDEVSEEHKQIISSVFQQYSTYQRDRSFFFFRQESLSLRLMGKNPDDYFERDSETHQKLAALKAEIKQEGLPVFEYDDIDAFGQHFLKTLSERLEKEAEKVPKKPTDWLAEEAEFHELFMADRTRRFVGRRQILDQIHEFVQQPSGSNVMLISGEPGSGKSTLMARFAEELSQQHPGWLIIPHFIGASPSSTRLRSTLKRICTLINQTIDTFDSIPDDIKGLIERFSELLEKIPPDYSIVILLDAVNQFDKVDNPQAMRWLPQSISANVRIVISTLAGEAYNALQKRRIKPVLQPINGLTADDRRELVQIYLQEIRHHFPNPQVEADFFHKISNATPLYILVALEELRMFGRFEELPAKINQFGDTVPALFNQVLERIEGDFNPRLVSDCMRYIAGGHHGMTADELQDLLKHHAPEAEKGQKRTDSWWSQLYRTFGRNLLKRPVPNEETGQNRLKLPDLLWSRLYRAFGTYLFERSGVIDFFHGQLKEAVLKRYLENHHVQAQTHQTIADYFEQRWQEPYVRAINELPYQFFSAGDKNRLKALLLNYEWIAAKLEASDVVTLITDYDYLPDDLAVRLVQGALQLSAHVLREDKTQLAGQLHGRLLSQSSAEIQALLKPAMPAYPWMRPLTASLTSPGGALRYTLTGHSREIIAVAVTPDGSRMISASTDATLKVWDLDTGAQLHTLTGHVLDISAVAVTPDGSRLISGSWDKTLKVWDLDSGTELHTLTGHSGSVLAVAMTPDGSRVISGSGDNTIKVWDLDNLTELSTLTGHSKEVSAVAVTPDGSRLISGSFDKTVKVWDLDNGTQIHTLGCHSVYVLAVAVTPDGERVISASGFSLKIWDLDSGAELHTLMGHSGRINAIAVTPDGSRVISGSRDNTLKIWDLDRCADLHTVTGHSGHVSAVAVTPDGSQMVTGSKDKTLKVWGLNNETAWQRLSTQSELARGNAVAVTPDGSQVIIGSYDKTVKVWDLNNATELYHLSGHSRLINAVAVTPDGSRVITGSGDNTVKIWDLNHKAELHTLTGHSNWVTAVAVTSNGSQVISGSRDNTLKVWDLGSRAELHTLSGHSNWITAVAVTPNGSRVVSGSRDNTIKVWDLNSNTQLHTLTGHSGSIIAIAVTPDGSRAVSGSSDNTLKVWNLDNGTELYTLTGHSGSVEAAAVAPDGSWLVSGSTDKTLKVWDLTNRSLLTSFKIESNLTCCAIAPDCRTLVACDHNGRIHFLRLEI